MMNHQYHRRQHQAHIKDKYTKLILLRFLY